MLRFHVEAQLCRYAPSPLLAIGSSCPHPIRSQCHVSPPFVGTRPSIGSKVRILACCSKQSPRPSLLKVRNLMLQAFPVEAWSTFAAVNQSFSEALPGGERKSSAAASSSPHLLSAWLLSHCLFSRILSARSWFAPAGRSALAANGRFAARRLDPEGNGLQLLERHLLQRVGGRCARAISVGLRQGAEKRALQASTRGRSFARIVWLSLVLWIDACKAFLWVW